MQRTKRDIETDIQKCKSDVISFRNEYLAYEQVYLTGGGGNADRKADLYYRWQNAEERVKKEIESYEEELRALSNGRDSYQKLQDSRVKEQFSEKKRQIQNDIKYYEQEIRENLGTLRHGHARDTYAANAALERNRNRLEEVKASLKKCKFDEYWAINKAKKDDLESEKKSIFHQIDSLNNEMNELPGYSTMINHYEQIQSLTNEMKSLGIFRMKEKKDIKKQIKSINGYYMQLFNHLNPYIESIQQRINSLQYKLQQIDTELTMPR